MNMRQWMMRQAPGRVAAVGLCLTVALMGCNVETIAHGRRFTGDGKLQVESLQPSCGCVSLRNVSGKKIWLESSFYGIARGFLVMNSNEVTRVLFDWAGSDNADFYEMVTFGVDAEGKPIRDVQHPLRIQDTLEEFAPLVDTPCTDKTCAFGPLAMNRMLESGDTQEREQARRGVNFSSVIEASAPLDKCGCMMLRNFSDKTVTLRATLHGVETGQIDLQAGSTIPVPFDWSGRLDTDVYVLEAVDVRPPNEPPPSKETLAAAPATAAMSAMTIRLKDYVEISGSLVNMTCKESYAEFVGDRRTSESEANELNVKCRWHPGGMPGLEMRSAFDADRQMKNPPLKNAVPPDAVPSPPRPQGK